MRILIADDNAFCLCALSADLSNLGYDVVTATNGAEAWEVLQQEHAPKLAILDWVMPKMDGLEVCRRVRALQRPEPPYLIILTSKEGKENIVAALDSGADDYLSKPFDRQELRARVRVGARIVGLQTSETIVYAFARAVEAKSPYTQGHADRVTAFALALADELDLPPVDRDILRRGGLLHDIGKISIPDAILNKPGKLTPEETAIIREHPAQGVKMIETLASLRDTIPIIRWHHERMDGRGYPDGIKSTELPIMVRALSVADVFDAVASERPYRAAMPIPKCLQILREDAASGSLDPELVALFCARIPERLAEPDSIALPAGGGERRPVFLPYHGMGAAAGKELVLTS